MTPELPAVPPGVPPAAPLQAFKDRRGWLIAFGIVEILIGALNLLIIACVLFLFLVEKAAFPNEPSSLSPAGLLTVTELLYGGLAVFFFTVGIGSIRCRNWARVSMIVASSLWLFIGTLSTVIMVVVFPHIPKPAGADFDVLVFTKVMIVFGFIFVVAPAILLLFYTRKGVKATCLARTPVRGGAAPGAALAASPAPRLPVPVIILVVFEAMGTFAVLGGLIRPATFLFGKLLFGFPALLILLAYSLVAALAAWLIYHREFTGWVLAVAKLSFGMASVGVTLAVRGWTGIFRDLGISHVDLRLYDQFPWFDKVIWIGALAFSAAYLIFLLYARKYFPRTKCEATT